MLLIYVREVGLSPVQQKQGVQGIKNVFVIGMQLLIDLTAIGRELFFATGMKCVTHALNGSPMIFVLIDQPIYLKEPHLGLLTVTVIIGGGTYAEAKVLWAGRLLDLKSVFVNSKS
ncbi:MAG TPA: hypothetical protein DDW49_10355 [Deltaproteobacteria bacterium]|nr:MAG: hypothetical protein A2048_08055 [Deltaproteobacteria bacterium GWA2_45_12]HBF13764.1 hypothetical protein [Deltaproteobacteria bacterium]